MDKHPAPVAIRKRIAERAAKHAAKIHGPDAYTVDIADTAVEIARDIYEKASLAWTVDDNDEVYGAPFDFDYGRPD